MSSALTIQQHDMITMLIEGNTITDIAKKLRVQRQTIYNWIAKDDVKAELDRRRRDLARQGNGLILKDITTYIDNIKELANDKSDKRVCLAANQYLLNRIYGNPTTSKDDENIDNKGNGTDVLELEAELKRFKLVKKQKQEK